MKTKLLTALFITAILTAGLSSCAEEEVLPKSSKDTTTAKLKENGAQNGGNGF